MVYPSAELPCARPVRPGPASQPKPPPANSPDKCAAFAVGPSSPNIPIAKNTISNPDASGDNATPKPGSIRLRIHR